MRIFNRAFIHKLGVYAYDIAMAGVAFALSLYFAIGFGEQRLVVVGAPEIGYLLGNSILIMAIAAIVFYFERLYRGFWRFVGFGDFIKILRASSLVILLFLPVVFLTSRGAELPRSALIFNWFLLVSLLTGPRLLTRMLSEGALSNILDPRNINTTRIPVLLIGAGGAADAFLREIARNPHAVYRVVGILTDRPEWEKRRIQGVEIFGSLDNAEEILSHLMARGIKVEKLILAKPDFTRAQIEPLLDLTIKRGVGLARLPRLTDFYDGGEISVRPVAITDLLGRPQVMLDRKGLEDLVLGRRVLVTGAGGSIGSELVRQIAALGPARLCLVDQSEFALYQIDTEMNADRPDISRTAVLCDVRNREALFSLFEKETPDLVFHAAALKHVPLMESHPCEAVLTNVAGTKNVADACIKHKVGGMVMVSTDKAVNPANIMGATKRLAEAYCQALDTATQSASDRTRFVTVRFGNVLGSNGSVVPLFQQQLAAGGPLTVTHPDIERFFMTIPEAVRLILQATVLGVTNKTGRGNIFVLDMGEPIKIVDLARKMIRLSGKRPDEDIKIKFIGLRPGEKLYEELSYDVEALTPVGAGGLFLATPVAQSLTGLSKSIETLTETATRGENARVYRLLKLAVSEFTHEPSDALTELFGDGEKTESAPVLPFVVPSKKPQS